jgi:hypothetical protein
MRTIKQQIYTLSQKGQGYEHEYYPILMKAIEVLEKLVNHDIARDKREKVGNFNELQNAIYFLKGKSHE